MKRKKIQPGEPVPISFSLEERDLILEHTFVGPEITDPLRIAPLKGSKVLAKFTLDDLDDLLGYIAAEANHTNVSSAQTVTPVFQMAMWR